MKTSVTIEGVLIPVDWEDDGRVRALALNTFDEREMRVEGLQGSDSRLWSLIGRKVRVTGRVHVAEVILVDDFEVVD